MRADTVPLTLCLRARLTIRPSLLLAIGSILGSARCQKPVDGSRTAYTVNPDASVLLQGKLGANADSQSLQKEREAPRAAGAATISFVPGDAADVRDWVPCDISSRSEKPGAYNIVVKTKTGIQEVKL